MTALLVNEALELCEAAKARLERVTGCDEPSAHRRLQRTAMNWRMRKCDVAAVLLGRPHMERVAIVAELLEG